MSDPFTAAELVSAFQGREGAGLAVVREAASVLEEIIRQRVLRDAKALGLDVDALAATLDGAAQMPTEKPKRTRAPTTKPEAPADGDDMGDTDLDDRAFAYLR